MALQISYRPGELDEYFGNGVAIDVVKKIFKKPKEDIPHAFLIIGPSGCGKTTMAYIIRDMLGCTPSGFKEYDAASERGIADIRKVRQEAKLRPLDGDVMVMFFDEVHGVTGPAQESMLKLLEHPPEHVYLILATTEPEKLKDTVIRRCTQIKVSPLNKLDMMELLEQICQAEEKEVSRKVLSKIHSVSWGSPGQAVKLLDEVIDMTSEEKSIEAIEAITFNETTVKQICQLMMKNIKPDEKWNQMQGLLNKFDGDPESARRGILGWFSYQLLKPSWKPSYANIMAIFTESYFATGKAGLVLSCYYACSDRSNDDIPF